MNILNHDKAAGKESSRKYFQLPGMVYIQHKEGYLNSERNIGVEICLIPLGDQLLVLIATRFQKLPENNHNSIQYPASIVENQDLF